MTAIKKGDTDLIVCALDTEGYTDRPWGLNFSIDGEIGYVVRANDCASLRWFTRWVSKKQVVMHNGIHDVPVLRAMGIEIESFHDTQVMAYHDLIRTGSGVLDSEAQNLGTLAYRLVGLRLGELKDLPGVNFATHTIPYTDEVMHYAGMDAIASWRIFQVLKPITETLPYQIDMGQVNLVEQMVRTGLPFDLDAAIDYYGEILDKLEVYTESLRERASRLGNRDFNPKSHPQVRELITRKIGLKVRKRTKGGLASTNEKALADHQDHPFVMALQAHRELSKLRGTYCEPLLEELMRNQ